MFGSIFTQMALATWTVGLFLFTRRYKVHLNTSEFKQKYGTLYTQYKSQGIGPFTVGIETVKKIGYAAIPFLNFSFLSQCLLIIGVSILVTV